jgi:hypothetical protein
MFTLQGPVNMQDRPVSVGRAGRRRVVGGAGRLSPRMEHAAATAVMLSCALWGRAVFSWRG